MNIGEHKRMVSGIRWSFVWVSAFAMTLVMVSGSETAVAQPQYDLGPKPREWGMGGQVRRSRVSKRLQELFAVEESAGPAEQDGFSLMFVRRRGDTELNIAFGYDPYNGQDGFYIDRGGDFMTPGDVDLVDFRKLRWFTADLSIVRHARLHKLLAARFGMGFGLGVLTGEIRRTDVVCTGPQLADDCSTDPNGIKMDKPANLPPVLPVVNILVGLQFRPFDALSINLDAGVHTMPYVGLSAALYLW